VRGSLAGNDTIDGLGGDDRIAAGSGNDLVDGGANGAAGDVAVFTGARSNYTVTVQGGSFVIATTAPGLRRRRYRHERREVRICGPDAHRRGIA
jgi:Ca2+-binding RTX toxin-like protein